MATDLTNLQIASLITDDRKESSYSTRNADGTISDVVLVDFPTVDDLMLQGMKAVAAEIKFSGITYESFQDREVVTQITRVRLPVERT
jgi:hypothetical protein